MNITEDFIIHFTGNASAVANGKGLANKGSFVALHETGDGTLLFGSCKGSGKTPYNCSVDFSDEGNPIARCSCPSRQIPCKHAVGLLFCKLQQKPFTVEEIPGDVAAKREKIKVRAEKKESASTEPKAPSVMTKQKAAAAVKKCNAQLDGIALAEKILRNIVLSGLHSIDRQNEKLYQGQVKELGNYYISGIQAALTDLLLLASAGQKSQDFAAAALQVGYLSALLSRSKAHLANKIADYEAFPNMTDTAKEATLHSSIEEQMGYAWKLSELSELGLCLENARLLQVGFRVYEEAAKRQFVDEGVWMSLTDGKIYLTRNYRPFKAQKYIRAEDSFFPLLETPALSVYPGDKNPRIRWEKSTQRAPAKEDFAAAKAMGQSDFAAVIKEVKNQLRSPLADKNPVFALKVTRLGKDGQGRFYAFDEVGMSLPLLPELFGFLLRKLSREQAEGQTLVCRFSQSADELLSASPIAMITDNAVIRFTY